MARKSKEQYHSELLEECLTEFERIQAALRDERLQCLMDRRFYSISGAQWEGPLGVQFENKPRIEVNKIHLAVVRIINEYRNNRISVDFVSKDGEDRTKLAETCSSLYRADEQDSVAEEAYDNGFEEAVGGGFGAWRLRACYEDEYDPDDERQRIRIEPIFDADSSVFFDLNAKRQDKADAKRCYVLTAMTRQAYKDEWGDDPASWPKRIYQRMFDWLTPDVVYVCEHYRVEEKREIVHTYRDGLGNEKTYCDEDFENDEELANFLEVTGWREVRQKTVKKRVVHKYIFSGNKILEDCGVIAGRHIPIIPVYGKRWFVDNVERCMGHVRLAKDAQRLKNMQLTRLAEFAAYSPLEKPIFTPEQIAGHQQMWADDNIKNYPYLLVNQLTDMNGNIVGVGPQSYSKPPDIPPAMAALLQLTEQDMQDILGNQQNAEEIQPNASGKAIELIQQKLDMQSFIYMSNMAKAVKRTGEVWLSMAQDIYIEEGRKMKAIGAQEQVESVELMRPVKDEETGETVNENDLSEADFDVVADVGPTSASKRQATVRALTSMMAITDDPQTRQVLGAMAMMNMEGEGIDEVRDYFRQKLITIGVVKPTKEEAEQLAQQAQNNPPDPNAIFLQASADEAQANAVRSRADTLLKVKQAGKAEADTMAVLSGVDQAEREQLMRAAEMLAQTPQT